jgi:cobalt-zinc-cadmium efflux system protein
VIEVHDLHVWTMGVGADVMTGHVVLAQDIDPDRSQAILVELSHCMREHFGIGHTTIQLEYVNLCLRGKSQTAE